MSTPSMDPAYAWYVTGQAPNQTIAEDDGRVIEGTMVYFRTAKGTAGSIFVPQSIFPQADVVRSMLVAAAAQVAAVDAMTG